MADAFKEPTTIAMISPYASGTGDGGLQPQVIETPAGQPNLVIRPISAFVAVGIRFVNVFLTVMLGILTGAMASDVIPAPDFLALVWKCAGLSLAGAGIGLIKDLVTIFSRLESKYPLLTGSI